jgi:DNA mismatch endonuclease (patch repair protein)
MNRSEIMRRVLSSNTAPERRVAEILKRLRLRPSKLAATLPGKPDFALRGAKVAIFVHGCFWHGHTCARGARVPKANRYYWVAKIARNRARDVRVRRALREAGWAPVTIWECQLKNEVAVARRLERYMN